MHPIRADRGRRPGQGTRPPRWRTALGALGALALATTAACSTTSGSASGTATTSSAGTAYHRPACHPTPPATPVRAVPVTGVPSAWTVTSFDGTQLRAYWFPATPGGSPKAPTVLMGPGWGETADTSLTSAALFGGLTIGQLNRAGFNVLTWDPRGFPPSTGTAELDSAAYEARDVEQLINWVATLPGVALNGPDNPAVGMVGASYGGGIQFTAAAVDCRIDAIVPTIAWHSLATSLYKADTIKAGWAGLLVEAGARMHLDPHIVAADNAIGSGTLSPAEVNWFTDAGPGALVSKITAPTLIIQGTVDNLFTLDEGVANYQALRSRGVPTHMIWFCGGHGACLTPPGDQQVITTDTIAWLDRYLKGQPGVDTGPTFQFVDQNGASYQAAGYPVPTASPLTATGHGTLALTAAGGSGPAHVPAGVTDPLAGFAAPVTPAEASNAVDVPITTGSRSALVVGSPDLTITYRGTVPPGAAPERVFAQVVDDATGMVLGNQITPIDVTLDGTTHTTTVPLEIVVAALHPGARLTLQLVATTVAYARPRLGGSITFSSVHVSLPVASGIAPR